MTTPSNSEDLFGDSDSLFETIELNPEFSTSEKKVLDLLRWTHKVQHATTAQRLQQVKGLTTAAWIIGLLMSSQGYYAVLHILTFLTPKERVLIAAATGELLMDFFSPQNKIGKDLSQWLCSRDNAIRHLVPNLEHLCSLPSGELLLREVKLLKSVELKWMVDEFCWIQKTGLTHVEYNPIYPIAVIRSNYNIYFMALSGLVRSTQGQILMCATPKKHEAFNWMSWNPNGEYLLVATKTNYHSVLKSFLASAGHIEKLSLCKLNKKEKNFFHIKHL
jgi:hypothetical protein